MLHSTPIPFMPNKEDDRTSVERSAFCLFQRKKEYAEIFGWCSKIRNNCFVMGDMTTQYVLLLGNSFLIWNTIFFIHIKIISPQPRPPPEKKITSSKVCCLLAIHTWLSVQFQGIWCIYKVLPSSIFCNYKKHKGSFAKKCEGVQDCLLLKSVYLSSNGG